MTRRLNSFIENNLLKSYEGIHHHGKMMVSDEELSPSLSNFIVLKWLGLTDKNLPNLIKQRYGTEL